MCNQQVDQWFSTDYLITYSASSEFFDIDIDNLFDPRKNSTKETSTWWLLRKKSNNQLTLVMTPMGIHQAFIHCRMNFILAKLCIMPSSHGCWGFVATIVSIT
jgi:hypothetical protein